MRGSRQVVALHRYRVPTAAQPAHELAVLHARATAGLGNDGCPPLPRKAISRPRPAADHAATQKGGGARGHGRLPLTRGVQGNGDRASTSRYPLVSGVSPVVGAPLTTSACARFVPRSDCYSSAPGANPQVSRRKQAPDHSSRPRRLVPWIPPELVAECAASRRRAQPVLTNQPCSGGESGLCDASKSAAGGVCEVAGGQCWATPGLMERFAEYSGCFCGHAAALDAFVED